MSEKLKVLYIMGTARSGSTILEILLAHGQRCLGVGELSAIVQDGFIGNKPCSCGANFHDCAFWSKVSKTISLSKEDIEEWARLQRKIEWHTGLLRQVLGLISNRDWERYRIFNRRLLNALRQVSATEVIVDSSKYAGRALALSRLNEIELSVVCLTRSPEGLMTSFRKPNKDEQRPKNPWAVFRYYAFVMLSLRLVAARLKQKVLVQRYEDIVSKPASQLNEIANSFRLDLSSVVQAIENSESFGVGHLVTGNRLRKSKDVRLLRSEDRELRSGTTEKLSIALMKLIACRDSR